MTVGTQSTPSKVASTTYSSRRRRKGDVPLSPWTMGAIYGDFGSGKTYLAGTADRVPEIRGVLFGNAEKGEDGIPGDCADIEITDISTYAEFARLYEFLYAHCILRDKNDVQRLIQLEAAYFKEDPKSISLPKIYRTVIIDSLTEIQKYCVYQLIGLNADSKLDDIPEYMQTRNWGQALEMILSMIRRFRDLPLHKIFIIQQKEGQDDQKQIFYRPALQGQAKVDILGFFDYVGYYRMTLHEGAPRRILHLMPDGPWKAKNRFEKFHGTALLNPDMQKILDARHGKL